MLTKGSLLVYIVKLKSIVVVLILNSVSNDLRYIHNDLKRYQASDKTYEVAITYRMHNSALDIYNLDLYLIETIIYYAMYW